MTKTLKDITLDKGFEIDDIRGQIFKDADGDVIYIKDVAEHGCSGGSCNNLIYFQDTEAFYTKHADEIDEMLQDYKDNTGVNLLAEANTGGNLRNFLAWWAYEVRAQEIMNELEDDNDPLICTAPQCNELQVEGGEFCEKHLPVHK